MKRSLSLFDVTCLGVNAIIGSGIFALPDDLYREMGGLSPLAFLLCAIGLLPVALCYAEASGRTERTGGPYVYARDAFGPWSGFVVGWLCFTNSIFSFAAVASMAGAYVGRFVPAVSGEFMPRAVGALFVLGFGALNYVGTKPSARATDLFTLCKLGVLFLLVAAALPSVQVGRIGAAPAGGLGLHGVGVATFIALFAVQGFEVAPVPAGETAHAQRNLPIAILVALGLSALIYVIVQSVVVGTNAHLDLPTDTPLADAARAVAPAIGWVVTVGGLISMIGFISGNAFGTPRYAFAAAEDGYLPRGLAHVHARFSTPSRAVVFTCVIASIFTLLVDYRKLIGMSNLTVAVQYLATCLAVLVLRRRDGAVPLGRFRAPGGPLVPLLGALVSLWIFTEGSRAELAFAAGALAVGVLLAFVSRRSGARARTSAPGSGASPG